MPRVEQPPEPWLSFLADIDRQLEEAVYLHCFGGFVLTQRYGVTRTTSDVDFVSLAPSGLRNMLTSIAGKGTPLHRKHGLYLDPVTVATPPADYAERLIPMFPGVWTRLHLFALEAHDVALAKLERNSERDRYDVQQLARAGLLKPEILRARYREELRPYLLARHEWHDQTLELWIESCWPR